MAIKDFVDFSLFTDPSSGFDLYSNSIRKGLSYDAYGDKRRFKAIVLSEPVPLRPEDVQYFTNTEGSPITAIKEKIEAAVGKRISQFTFKARIVGPNSPHLFLPDPCNSTYADNPEEAQKLIAMHTTFTSNEDTALQVGTELPRKYSVVEVLLNKNVFGYDLQKGTFLNVVINPSAPSIDSNEDTDCDNLKDIFDDPARAIPDPSFYRKCAGEGNVSEFEIESLPAQGGGFQAASRKIDDIDMLIIHTSEGPCPAHWFADPSSPASAHYSVYKTGKIYRSVPDKDIAHHAGNRDVNRRSLGIEIAAKMANRDWTKIQMRYAAKLAAKLVKQYGIVIDRDHIKGHAEVSGPGGHQDPGPDFPWEKFIEMVQAEYNKLKRATIDVDL